MMTKTHLEKLSQVRLDDAICLLEKDRASAAYYLAGYAVELALKACIAKLFLSSVIPGKAFVNAIYTHKLADLLATAGLRPEFEADSKTDKELASRWGVVSQWTEESRYESWDPISATTLLEAIRNPDHGVYRWVKKHW